MSIRTLLAASIAALASLNTYAAGYPEKPVRIVVPYSPGGAVDVVARKVAQKLQEQTGQPFVIENKPGATGTIGTQAVARAEPDGYTLLAIDNTYSVLPYVFKKLPWDHAKALTPITVAAFTPVVIAVRGDSPHKDLKSLVADGRANPAKLTYGTGGAGSAPHFSAEAFELAMKQFLASMSAEPGGMEPAAFSKLISEETARWQPVAAKANIERQ